jgi:hypothetical protein
MRKFSKSLLLAGVVAMGGLAGCGDDVTVTEQKPPVQVPRVTGVTVTPSTTSIQVGGTVTLVANVSIDSGSIARTVTWSTSAANIATVSAAGVVTGVAPGTAVITATSTVDPTKQGTAAVTVTNVDPGVRSVTVQPPSAILAPGQTLQAVANVDANAGVARTVTWATSAAAVATVSATGIITAVAPGSATITAASTVAPSVVGAIAITVRAAANASVSIQKVTVNAGGLNVPVNLNAVTGQIEVTLNVDPGDQILDRVAIVIGNDTVAVQRFGAVTAIIDGVSAAVVPSEITLSVNTAEITNLTTGAVRFTNGPKTLKAVLYTRSPGGGTASVAASVSTNMIFRNQSGFLGKVTLVGTTANANDQIGNRWGKGGLQVDAVPVLYGSTADPFAVPTVASAQVAFGTAGCGAGGVRTQPMTAAGANFSATFNNTDATAAATNVVGYEFQIAACGADLGGANQQAFRFGEVPSITAIGSDGNPIELANAGGGFGPGGGGFLNDPYNPIVGGNQSTTPNQAFAIRLDNLAPTTAATPGVFTAIDVNSPQNDATPPIVDVSYGIRICAPAAAAATPAYCPTEGKFVTLDIGDRSNGWLNDAVKLAAAYIDNERDAPYTAVDFGVSRQVVAGPSQVTFTSRIAAAGTANAVIDATAPVADPAGQPETGPAALTMRSRAEDKLANASGATTSSIAIDRTAPVLTFLNTPNDVSLVAPQPFNGSATDPQGAAGSVPSFFNSGPNGTPMLSQLRLRTNSGANTELSNNWFCPATGTYRANNQTCASWAPGTIKFAGSLNQPITLGTTPANGNGYYEIESTVNDQAANTSAPATAIVLFDNVQPVAGGVSFPSFLTGNASTTFNVDVNDNIDLAGGFMQLGYNGGARTLQFPQAVIGSYGTPLTFTGTLSLTTQFMRNIQPTGAGGVPGGAFEMPTNVNAVAADVAGNLSAISTANIGVNSVPAGQLYQAAAAVPPATNAGFFTTWAANAVPAANLTLSRDGTTAGLPLSTPISAAVTGPTAPNAPFPNPFLSRVDFWVAETAAPGIFKFVGSSFSPAVTEVGGTRTYTFTVTWDPSGYTAPTTGATYQFIAIGVNNSGDAAATAFGPSTITVSP